MVPHYSKIHNRFKLDGRYFNHDGLKEVAYNYVKEGQPFESAIGQFLLDWLDNNPHVEVYTSGSTGAPKCIQLQKQAMVHSAIATGNAFNLQPGNTALLCLPAEFIAGKMMLVRAIILGLELDSVKPTVSPVFNYQKHYDFSAMTPMQLSNVIGDIDTIKTLIIGGGKVSSALKSQVQDSSAQLFETYGMTETITHIAIKPINGINATVGFKTLPNISILKDERDCLVIKASYISEALIVTNDVVELVSDSEFQLLGRYDSIINSGGIKIQPEQIEAQLATKIKEPFFLSSKPDDELGERLILVLESNTNTIDAEVFKDLHKYHIPKEIVAVSEFKYTKSGKIDRITTLKQIVDRV